MINYQGCQYSVPPEYLGKSVTLQVFDGYIHVYYNTELVTVHEISKNKLNYHEEHYVAIAQKSHSFKEENIAQRAKENLKLIGGLYSHE